MSNIVSSSLSATGVSLHDSPHPDWKVLCSLFYFYFLTLWSFRNSTDLSQCPLSKPAPGEDPLRSQYMAARVLVFSIQVRRTGELEGHSGSALVPNGHCLDAGEDLPLMAGQSHAHVQQIPETKQDQWWDVKNYISVFLIEYLCTKYLIFLNAWEWSDKHFTLSMNSILVM